MAPQGGLWTRGHGSGRGVLPWGYGSSVLSLVVTDLTTSKVGSITGVEEDPRFAFIAKALYGTILCFKKNPPDKTTVHVVPINVFLQARHRGDI